MGGNVIVGLTTDHLDVISALDSVKRPEAGAVVMFAGVSHSF